MVEDMIRIFEAQRLVSLTTLFDLADNLESVSRGEKLNTALAGRLATRISEIQLPRTDHLPARKETRWPSATGPTGTSRRSAS